MSKKVTITEAQLEAREPVSDEEPHIVANDLSTAEGFWAEICVNGRPSKKLFEKAFRRCEQLAAKPQETDEQLIEAADAAVFKKYGWGNKPQEIVWPTEEEAYERFFSGQVNPSEKIEDFFSVQELQQTKMRLDKEYFAMAMYRWLSSFIEGGKKGNM